MTQRDSWEIPTFNRFETYSQECNTPQRAGKKKATSPLDQEITMKKQKECDTETNDLNNVIEKSDNVVTDENEHHLTPQNLTETISFLSSPHKHQTQMQMPTPLDSNTLYYGPSAISNEHNRPVPIENVGRDMPNNSGIMNNSISSETVTANTKEVETA